MQCRAARDPLPGRSSEGEHPEQSSLHFIAWAVGLGGGGGGCPQGITAGARPACQGLELGGRPSRQVGAPVPTGRWLPRGGGWRCGARAAAGPAAAHRLAGAGLGDGAAAVAAAEARAVAAATARAAAAVVGDVVPAPDGRPAGVGQCCRALPTPVGVAGLRPGLLALDLGGPLGPLGAFALWGLLGGLQEPGGLGGAGPRRQRLRPPGRGRHLQLLPQVGPQVSPGDADSGIGVLDDRLLRVHGSAWQGQTEETILARGRREAAAQESCPHPPRESRPVCQRAVHGGELGVRAGVSSRPPCTRRPAMELRMGREAGGGSWAVAMVEPQCREAPQPSTHLKW